MKCNLVNENFKSNYVESLLKSKGIIDIEGYFHPTSKYLQSPENLKNIAVGGVLYHRIVSEGGRVLIIVDSDVDGYTSGSIIYQYTKKINPNCQIDYWLHDGKQHGLSDHIGRLMEEKVNYDLLILPDSSSNDAEYHDMLEDISLPCLIIDHHITDVPLSANAVVINNQLSPNYINKDLTGSGMVYQFCRYIDSKYGYNYAEDFIDLAAWGIVGDMGSMISVENRYITYVGLSNIKNNLFKAIVTKQAYSISGKMSPTWDELSEKINPISVAFYVVPMINALIRVGSMEEKELLFTAFIDGTKKIQSHKRGAKPGDLEEAAIEAVRIATNSRNHQNKILEQMEELIDTKIFKYDLLENKVLFVRLEEENFPSELNGLLAMRLAAKYKKPSVVARLSPDGNDKGSGRGLNNSELKDFRKFLVDSGYVVFAQGHPNAFGCSFNDKILSDFHKYANGALKDYNFIIHIYCLLSNISL